MDVLVDDIKIRSVENMSLICNMFSDHNNKNVNIDCFSLAMCAKLGFTNDTKTTILNSKADLRDAAALDQFLDFAFTIFDKRAEDLLSTTEFERLINAIQLNARKNGQLHSPSSLSDDNIKAEFRKADTDSSGFISREEFSCYFLSNQLLLRYFKQTKSLIKFKKEIFGVSRM